MQQRLKSRIGSILNLLMVPVAWMAAAISPAQAQVTATPSGAGTSVSPTGDQYDISGGTQAGGNLFHEFDEFSLRATETANFLGDSGVFNIVGQISGGSPSYIEGQVQVSGTDADLYLVNPSGIFFGPDAQLNLPGSLTATTADQISFDSAVLNVLDQGADYSAFSGDPSALHFTEASASAVVNQGALMVAPGESISLTGGNVVNTGTLSAPGGEIGLVAVGGEDTVRYGIPGSLLSLEMAASSVSGGAGFAVTDLPALLTGRSTPVADGLSLQPDGSYKLGPLQIEAEEVSVSGEISTRATAGDGGAIALLGRSIDVSGAVIDASGDNGGNIRIGRDVSSDALPTSELLLMNRTSVVRADGLAGAGGSVAVGTRNRATVEGDISAQGTTLGGLIETSSPRLNQRNLRVDASGQADEGQWLVASGEIDIVSSAAGFNQIDPSSIEAVLDSGTDVEITTTAASGGTGDISLSDSIVQTGGGNAQLTLTGRQFINSGATIDLSSAGQLTLGINQVNAEVSTDSSSVEGALDAIGNVSGDRTISLGSGTYDFTGAVNIDTQVDIEGAGIGQTLLSTSRNHRIFLVGNQGDVGLSDVTVTTSGLGASDFGGGLFSTGALRVSDSLFEDNRVNGLGGAIASFGNLLNVSNTQFINNQAQTGGAIAVKNTTLTLTDASQFIGNQAGSGGALYGLDSPAITIENNVLFQGNTATDDGGAIQLTTSTLDIRNAQFEANTSVDDGGAIALNGSTITVSDTTFDGNESASNGGAIRLWNSSSLSLVDSILSDNTSVIDGGALSAIGTSDITLRNTQLLGNEVTSSSGNGGGLSLLDRSSATIDAGSIIANNTTLSSGGGIRALNSDLSLSNSTLRDNFSGGKGGGIAAVNTTLNLSGTTVVNNHSNSDGGGVSAADGSIVSIDGNSQFVDNSADDDGGGLYLNNNVTAVVDEAQFMNNTAADDGGGLRISFGSDALLSALQLTSNTASDGGGLSLETATATISDSVFESNRATDDGGGVYTSAGSTVALSDVLFDENRANAGGGLRAADSTVSVNNSVFSNNTAMEGGGLAIVHGAQLVLADTVVANNKTTNRGGGLIVDNNGIATVTGTLTTDADGIATSATTRFVNNQAGRDGGGISVRDEALLDVNGVLFRGNFSGDDGGGVSVTEISRATINNANFENNTVAENGGGLYSNNVLSAVPADNKIVLAGSRFIENEAGQFGGGLYHGTNGSAVVQGSLFRDNDAVENGGGVHVRSGALALENSQLLANQAHFGAGLAVDSGGDVVVADTAFAENIAAAMGGGAMSDRSSRLQVSGSTFERNEAISGGGLFNLGTSEIVNATFSGNLAQDSGGGIRS
ncbi:MAG: filamentous hemagglutinin N-terminal domain-containing protein, partial [Cyanobacteria bacterium J06598_3]